MGWLNALPSPKEKLGKLLLCLSLPHLLSPPFSSSPGRGGIGSRVWLRFHTAVSGNGELLRDNPAPLAALEALPEQSQTPGLALPELKGFPVQAPPGPQPTADSSGSTSPGLGFHGEAIWGLLRKAGFSGSF